MFPRLLERFRSLSNAQKVVGLFLAALVISAGVVGGLWVSKPHYGLLYGGLYPKDAGEVVEKLKGMHVPYRLKEESSGTSVYVPQSRVYDLRLELAKEGLPRGGEVGFELFDKNAVGLTDFVLNLNYQRALQGELSRTISRIEDVAWARVHLVLPEKSLFLEQERKPSAAVLLKLKPGRKLRPKEVGAITHLVAASIPGLKPEEVVIVDDRGDMLAAGGMSPEEGEMLTNQSEVKERIEKGYEKKVQSILSNVLGPGRSVVRVSVDVDFSQIERIQELFDPDSVAIRSEQDTTEKISGKGSLPYGIPGVMSNLPWLGQATPAGQTSSQTGVGKVSKTRRAKTRVSTPTFQRTKGNKIVNYEVSKTVERFKSPLVKIKRVSVAVAVDGKYKKEGEKLVYVPRSDDELQKIQALIKGAIGYDKSRGDQVEVVNVPMAKAGVWGASELINKEYEKYQRKVFVFRVLESLGKAILALVILLFLFRLVKRVPLLPRERGKFPSAKPGGVPVPGRVEEEEVVIGALPIQEEIKALAEKEPEALAQLAREWISEEGEK